MILIRLIVVCEMVLTLACVTMQVYAIFSPRWALFQTKHDLGLVPERGNYGLWRICSTKLLASPVDGSSELLQDIDDCNGMDTLYKPLHNRASIAFFAIAHLATVTGFLLLVGLRLLELYLYNTSNMLMREASDPADSGHKQSRVTQHLHAWAKSMFEWTGRPTAKHCQHLNRLKLWIMTAAVTIAVLAVWRAVVRSESLRESDLFREYQITTRNYRTVRGPGFFAQMVVLIVDMLLTSLTAIEARVLVVLQQLEDDEEGGHQTITASNQLELVGTPSSFVVNPFDPRTPPVDSLQVRKLKQASRTRKQEVPACSSSDVCYVNPTFVCESQSVC